ncbi:MAG TPA: hypothetical protein VGB50_06250 [Flavobacterium sp.]|jgi:hypothetical protein
MKEHLYPQVDLTLNNLVENSSTVIDLQDQNIKLTQSNTTLILMLTGLGVAILITVVVYAHIRSKEDEQAV